MEAAKRPALLLAGGAALSSLGLLPLLELGCASHSRRRGRAAAGGRGRPPRAWRAPWTAEAFAEHEGRFEQQVNDVFCHAKGLQVCQLGSVAEAKQLFPLRDWPVDSVRAPGRCVATSCEGFKDSVRLWGYQDKMQLCRLCADVSREEQQIQSRLGAQHAAQVLAAVTGLSFGELQWCGEYLAVRRPEHDVGHSPYWKHRREFQALLVYDTPPCSLVLAVKALQLLEIVAALCCVALLRWAWALRAMDTAGGKTGKIDVVTYRNDAPLGG
ncbi:uncharacterized protein IUM83_13431 [Phytophthora cinnamomi]|uniref:uncharacterized protein n=1 Tax=Phytophthora cinnamomi TaxID=4785 RepID=UPI0035595D0D|nr:hypothetical protein IUM83_13431 [Phytophthora cinnamomi]